jgi:hypothetical protein
VNLLGFGLGAVAASVVAGRNASLRRLVLVAPAHAPYVASRMLKANGAPAALRPEQVPQAWLAGATEADADALSAVAIGEHSTLIVHGAADRFIAPETSVPYLAMLEAANRSIERVLVARADHLFTSPGARQACIDRVVRFMKQPPTATLRPRLAAGQTAAGDTK